MLRFGNSMLQISQRPFLPSHCPAWPRTRRWPAAATRGVRRICSIVALFLGALFGAYLLRYGVALPLFVTGACVLLTTAAYAVIAEDRFAAAFKQ